MEIYSVRREEKTVKEKAAFEAASQNALGKSSGKVPLVVMAVNLLKS